MTARLKQLAKANICGVLELLITQRRPEDIPVFDGRSTPSMASAYE